MIKLLLTLISITTQLLPAQLTCSAVEFAIGSTLGRIPAGMCYWERKPGDTAFTYITTSTKYECKDVEMYYLSYGDPDCFDDPIEHKLSEYYSIIGYSNITYRCVSN